MANNEAARSYMKELFKPFEDFDRTTREMFDKVHANDEPVSSFALQDRARALVELLDIIGPAIDGLRRLEGGGEEQREIFFEYDGLLATLMDYRAMAENELDEAEQALAHR